MLRAAPLMLSLAGRYAYRPQHGTIAFKRKLTGAGAIGPTSTFSDAGQDASGHTAGFDPTGVAIVAWERPDGVNDRSQYAAGP